MRLLVILAALISGIVWADDNNSTRPNTGLDPTEIIGRFELNYEYLEKKDGTERQSIGSVLDWNLSKTSLVGLQVPVTYAKPLIGNSETGIGDITISYKTSLGKIRNISTAIGAGIKFDTATEKILGEEANTLNLGMFNSYKTGDWLFANITFLKKSDKKEKDQITLVPLIAYQPLDTWYSYASLGFGFSFFTDTGEEAGTATFNLGKIMPNKDVYSLGTRFTVVGEADNDTVIQLGYRRLF